MELQCISGHFPEAGLNEAPTKETSRLKGNIVGTTWAHLLLTGPAICDEERWTRQQGMEPFRHWREWWEDLLHFITSENDGRALLEQACSAVDSLACALVLLRACHTEKLPEELIKRGDRDLRLCRP